MKTRSIFIIFILAFFLGLAAFLGHTDTDNTEQSETTQEAETTADNSKSKPNLTDPKVEAEVVKKVKELLELAKEGSVKGYTLGPYTYSKTIKGEDLDSDELSKVIQELHKEIDRLSKKDLNSNNIKFYQKALSGTSKIVIDSKEVDKLSEEIKKLVQDEGVESENLTEKIKELLNKHKIEDFVFGVGDAKVIEIDPSGSAEIIKDSKKLKELETKIKELVENSDTVSDELAELIKKLVEKKAQDSSNILDKNHGKVVEVIPKISSKVTTDSKAIDELKKRVDQLEEKIDLLIQKLDGNNTEPSEPEK